ncbi:hypothetical protein [Marivirga lumbricoides]
MADRLRIIFKSVARLRSIAEANYWSGSLGFHLQRSYFEDIQ